MTQTQSPRDCIKCGTPMIYVKHIEPDGDQGSDESYWECPEGHDQEPCAEVLATDPWKTLPQAIELLIDKTILELHPFALDEEVPALLKEWDNRSVAIEYLVEKLTKQLKAE